MRVLLLAVLATVAEARPAERPAAQALACPSDADSCRLELSGTLVSSRRDAFAKWDNLRISTVVDGKRAVIHASINIPHRTRLKLKAGTRYTFTIAARKPFGAGDLWVVDAIPP